MAVDGPGIIASDLAHDTYNQILDLYDAGLEVAEIKERISKLEDVLFDDVDLEIYLAASIKAFWEIGQLDSFLYTRLVTLIESGTSVKGWNETGDETLAKSRLTVLKRFLRQCLTSRKNPRLRKKFPKITNKLFVVGDCLELNAENKTYRGVVCKILEYRGQCEYAILVMHPKTISTIRSFASGQYYGMRIPHYDESGLSSYKYGPHVIRPEHRMLIRAGNPFRIVGHVELEVEKFTLGSFGGVMDMSHVVEDFERTQINSPVFHQEMLPLSELLKEAI